MPQAVQTLFYPFDNGVLDWPLHAARGIFYNAQPAAALQKLQGVTLYTTSAGMAKILELSGAPFSVTDFEAGALQYALCLLPKQKEQAMHDLAQCCRMLGLGGLLVACAGNDSGGKRIEGYFEELGLTPQSLSKNKCRVVWGRKESENALAGEWIAQGGIQKILNGRYYSCPGLFGWDMVDPGSTLLAAHLPPLSGVGADFGCGYGFLSAHSIAENPGVTLYAVDDDARAVQCCARNVPAARCLWRDLRHVPEGIPPLDWVVMNPPFHSGKDTDADLGRAFIQTAAHMLKPGGRLYMVANRHLAYETVLEQLFAKVKHQESRDGFKVIFAEK